LGKIDDERGPPMDRDETRHALTPANRVTILRILGVPVFILLLLYYTLNLSAGQPKEFQRVAALVVFLAIALTDAVDGFMARARGEITRLGSILDPIADKALLVSALILLTRPSIPKLQPQFPIVFTLIVISRDALLIAGAFVVHHETGRVQIRPRWTGKTATVLQMLAITWALAKGPITPFVVLVGAAGLFTIVSWIQYLVDGVRQLERRKVH
jgi:CDP-diacylglycerol--glycerol-3-phosphate 3-phosphatidyltransferase